MARRAVEPADVGAASSSAADLGPEERIASVIGGGVLAAVALARRGPAGLLLAALGAYGVYRGATGRCPATRALSQAPVLRALGAPTRARAAITIDRSPAELYAFWRRLENLPRFLHHIASIETQGEQTRWMLAAPKGRAPDVLFVWQVEIVEDIEGRLLAWRTVPGSAVQHHGLVRFVPAPGDRGTEVHVELEYSSSRGRLPAPLIALLGRSPDEQLASDLRRLEQLIETGEVATTMGQPTGARRHPIARLVALRERLETLPALPPEASRPNGHKTNGSSKYGPWTGGES